MSAGPESPQGFDPPPPGGGAGSGVDSASGGGSRSAAVVQARPLRASLGMPFGSSTGSPITPPDPLELRQLATRDAALDALLVALVGVAFPYLPQILLAPALGSGANPIEPSLLLVSKYIECGMVIGLLCYLVLRHRLPAAAFGVRVSDPFAQLAWGGGALVAGFGYSMATGLLLMPLAQWFASDLEQRVEFMQALPLDNVGVSAALMLAVGVHEELLFRGLLLPLLRRVMGGWIPAALLCAALFGSLHIAQGVLAVVQVTGLGLVLSWFFVKSRSVLAVALAHFIYNFLMLQLARLITQMDLLPQ